jgi:DNA-binding transcriptional LysR family regulator
LRLVWRSPAKSFERPPQGILEANERARRYFAGSNLRGRVRFGASEDFVQSRLREVREFTGVHRAVDLELTVGLSGGLLQALDAGELDLVLAKRRPGEDRGRLVRREKLVWVGSDPVLLEPDRPLPLILYPPPSISRAIALEALERTRQSWRIVCTSSSFSGLNAAALAGLGVTVQADGVLPLGRPFVFRRGAVMQSIAHVFCASPRSTIRDNSRSIRHWDRSAVRPSSLCRAAADARSKAPWVGPYQSPRQTGAQARAIAHR